MVYQYLGEEQADQARMRKVINPYFNLPAQPAPSAAERRSLGAAAQLPPEIRPESSPVVPPREESSVEKVRVPGYIKGPAQPGTSPAPQADEPPIVAQSEPDESDAQTALVAEREAPGPTGFLKRTTPHFTIYSEGDPASDAFLELLETLHANLMLDLASFSPWAQVDRVQIVLFKNQDTYRRMTGRPAWSGGASSVPKRRIYLYESAELPGILAHELCHIYFDSFFTPGRPNPLWLSEGMATLIQVERGLAAPNWLRENLEILERGGGYSLEELMKVNSTAGSPDTRVRLWYAESYSVVRFLIRTQYLSSFYKFSSYLREGRSVSESLYRAYGMPYTRIKALEYAWRYNITTNRLSRLQ
ncbi:MAG TPA: hypothetical protein DEB40_11145 [Elusimicrobia bacterium]|nr:hypothetical protein [Elusimicrobiota bacterium]HBT62287.1 hypothetical protein [Elusimicrobiota bacterium]